MAARTGDTLPPDAMVVVAIKSFGGAHTSRANALVLASPGASHTMTPMVAMGALEPGTVLGGDFRVKQPLGSGGMGAVYVAEQISTGNQRALKIMDAQLVRDADLRERFVNEARVGARIESDHVVQVIAAGVDPATEMPWLVMELLQGLSLSQHVTQRGRLHPREVAEVVSQLAHALDAAHRVGVIHRDLKPDNVFLAKPRREGIPFTVKVLDFGIAKILQGTGSGMTATLGTPLWMAPEQTTAGADVLPTTDIWAVGLLVFWMLTGQVYWRAARTQPPSLPVLMREVVLDPIEPASSRAAELGLAAALPPGFDAWLSCCLHRDPGQRFATASACRDALLAVMHCVPGPSVTPPAPSGTVPLAPYPSSAANTMTPSGNLLDAVAHSSAQPVAAATLHDPTATTGAAPAPPRPRSYLPHVAILTCGVIVLALIGSCVSVIIYGTYRADTTPPPVVRVHNVLGFDAKRFNPDEFFPNAQTFATDHDSSAELVRISVTGVDAGTTIDLTKRGTRGKRSAIYSYRADRAHRDHCMISVVADDDGITSLEAKSPLCTFAKVPPPKCTVRQVRDKAVKSGAPPTAELSITYGAFTDGKAMWSVDAGDFSKLMPDDCS